MTGLSMITDSYDRKARLYPALLLWAPIAAMLLGVAPNIFSKGQYIATVLVGCGGAYLLVQLARDLGKQQENALFESWGGMPSVAIFRHRDVRLDPITKARYHKALSAMVKGTKPPSLQEENADPKRADQVYSAWSTYLRAHTRDGKQYPLLLRENINYGYRRNVCGLRPVGIVVSVLSTMISAAWLHHLHAGSQKLSAEALTGFALTLLLTLLWTYRFSPSWVRLAADAYAERLAESVDLLSQKQAL